MSVKKDEIDNVMKKAYDYAQKNDSEWIFLLDTGLNGTFKPAPNHKLCVDFDNLIYEGEFSDDSICIQANIDSSLFEDKDVLFHVLTENKAFDSFFLVEYVSEHPEILEGFSIALFMELKYKSREKIKD